MEEKNTNENKSKGGKKNTVLMTFLIMLLMVTGVYAWFSVSNRARVENLSLIADHQGNLQIADDTGNGPGTYSDVLNLATAKNDVNIAEVVLSPVTTKDGVNFFSPNYDSGSKTVSSVSSITDRTELKKYYIYEKTFYLRAGHTDSDAVATIKRSYDIALYGIQSNNKSEGCYIYQPSSKGETAANAIRISFTIDNGDTYVYEPNSDAHNSDTNRAINGIGSEYGSFKNLYRQKSNGVFESSPKANESEKLFTLAENADQKVTMRIWIEGTDNDCTNSIASDMVSGQIQFISTEIKN